MEEKLKQAILMSGHNLHFRIVKLLEELGWQVSVSPYFCDDLTEKPREIDIVAKKLFTGFAVVLCIECKYFKESIAFRFHTNDKQKARVAVKLEHFNPNKFELLEQGLEPTHHYFKPEIGKLYDPIIKSNDDVFDAFTKATKSLIFFRKMGRSSTIYYPLVVYEGIPGIYLIRNIQSLSEKYLNALESFERLTFGFDYFFKDSTEQYQTEYFCVDFLHENCFKQFLEDTETNEIKKIQDIISFYRKTRSR